MALYEVVPETRDVISEEAAYVTINLMEGLQNTALVHDYVTQGLKKQIIFTKIL